MRRTAIESRKEATKIILARIREKLNLDSTEHVFDVASLVEGKSTAEAWSDYCDYEVTGFIPDWVEKFALDTLAGRLDLPDKQPHGENTAKA